MAVLLVEVDVATRRPPGAHARVWTWVSVDDGPGAEVEAREIACQMAAGVATVVMPVGSRVIDWRD